MSTFMQLLSILRPFASRIALSILLGIATIGAGVGLVGTSAFLIASAALHPSIAELQVAIVGVRFFGISRAGFRYLERLVSHSVNLRILSQLRRDFYEHIEPGAPVNLQPMRSGDLLERVMGDLETLENFYVRFFAPFVVASVITVGMSILVGGYAFEIGLILGCGLLLNGFLIPALGLLITLPGVKLLTTGRVELSARLVEYLQGLEDLASSGAVGVWSGRILEVNSRLGTTQSKLTQLNGMIVGFNLLVMNITILAAVVLAIPLVSSEELTGVSLAVVLLLVSASFEATVNMPAASQNLNASLEAARRLFAIRSQQKPSPVPLEHLDIQGSQGLEFVDVDFTYPEDNREVLQDISFRLLPREMKAVVGLSGSGKTTLLSLLQRFWEPDAGVILLDGKNSKSLDLDAWRSNFGIIGQSLYLFNTTLRENLLLANLAVSDAEMQSAMQRAGLLAWLQNLPEGLDTWVGEHGLRLSGGERQRLAIARMLLADARYILLDEPTANLDAVNEMQIFDTFRAHFQGKGCLLITHHLELLKDVTEILVLHQSRIVERGTYQELIQKGGVFSEMVAIQQDLVFPLELDLETL